MEKIYRSKITRQSKIKNVLSKQNRTLEQNLLLLYCTNAANNYTVPINPPTSTSPPVVFLICSQS
jgi:hypothetical protein